MNNEGLWKTMENVKMHRDIKLVTANERRDQLVSEPNYTAKYFSEDLLAKEMKNIKVKMNTPFFNKQSIFDPRPKNCFSFPKKLSQKIV